MAKLPENFVKPPATSRLTTAKPAGKEARRTKRAVPIAAEVVEHARSVLVRLSPEEHDALTAACTALLAVGETVSVEDMIKQVITRWMAATRAIHGPAMPEPRPPKHATIVKQLRALAAEPLRRWRALGETLDRWSRVFTHRSTTR